MNAIMQFCQTSFSPVVVIFTVFNLLTIGLQVRIPNVIGKVSNLKFLALMLFWGWIVGPALGFLLTRIIPLAEPYVVVMFIASLAPCAPFLPPMIERAHADVDFAGAFIPIAAIGTVVFLPLLAPVMIKGISIDPIALAKPLIMTVFIPLVVGALLKTYAGKVADKIFKPVKLTGNLATLLTIILALLLYSKLMLSTAGSFALLSLTIFTLVMAFLTYQFGFGFKQEERSIMSLGMGTRNIAAVLMGVMVIPDRDPRMVAMVILWTLWTIILAFIFSPLYSKKASKATKSE